mmetsp:Transcript_17491/g.56744  ORF Transcript_17491/g.56744 Transcript_17491/m.56744 type:complete len:254 (-) Transcript_17491:448-1209(-)
MGSPKAMTKLQSSRLPSSRVSLIFCLAVQRRRLLSSLKPGMAAFDYVVVGSGGVRVRAAGPRNDGGDGGDRRGRGRVRVAGLRCVSLRDREDAGVRRVEAGALPRRRRDGDAAVRRRRERAERRRDDRGRRVLGRGMARRRRRRRVSGPRRDAPRHADHRRPPRAPRGTAPRRLVRRPIHGSLRRLERGRGRPRRRDAGFTKKKILRSAADVLRRREAAHRDGPPAAGERLHDLPGNRSDPGPLRRLRRRRRL